MNKANQIQFKAELELDLKSPEDIQKWALDILESNPSDELALEICFLADQQQITEYFKKILITDFDINIRESVINKLLNNYIFNKITSIRLEEGIYPFFTDILLLSKYLESKSLNALLTSYDDELYLALENYSPSEPMEVFQNFINDLREWQKSAYLA